MTRVGRPPRLEREYHHNHHHHLRQPHHRRRVRQPNGGTLA
jgi:hypothetical protein